jgi:cell filamentation protein
VTDPTASNAWQSYLMPGTDVVLCNIAGLTDPTAADIFERIVSAQAERELRTDPQHQRTFDLAHLSALHKSLFGDVWPFAGEMRYVDVQKVGQTGEPFVHHAWIGTYTAAVTEQLRREHNLEQLSDPGQWADRAGYYWAALLHAHPFREGSGRVIRLWLGQLAEHAGHQLDWRRSAADRNVHVARAAAHGDYEPIRALLTQVAGGDLGIDRPRAALDDLDKGLHYEAWARTGLIFGTDEHRATLPAGLEQLARHVDAILAHLATLPAPAGTATQPPPERWHGLAVSCDPRLVAADDWPDLASELDRARAAGLDVAARLRQLAAEGSLTNDNPAAALRSSLVRARNALSYRLAAGPPPGPAPPAGTAPATPTYTSRPAPPRSGPAR